MRVRERQRLWQLHLHLSTGNGILLSSRAHGALSGSWNGSFLLDQEMMLLSMP